MKISEDMVFIIITKKHFLVNGKFEVIRLYFFVILFTLHKIIKKLIN